MSEFDGLRDLLREFAVERDWEQFHDPKNLAMAVASEAGELLAEFRWLTPGEANSKAIDEKKRKNVSHEMADTLIFLIRLADVLDIDLVAAVREKIEINRVRFPVVQN
jgi:NTP pyrophosphatase (non-canonical NTP hydrolase)